VNPGVDIPAPATVRRDQIMEQKELRILLIEDDPDDELIVREMFDEAIFRGTDIKLIVASSLSRGIAILLEHPFDIVLSDLGLPDSLGLSSIEELLACCPDVPIVVMTGNEDEKTGIEAVKRGAQDFILKGHIDSRLLMRVVHYAMERHQHIMERMRLNSELQKRVRELEQFADYLSHNIKNNLLIIKRISDMAETCPDFVLKNSKTLAGSSESLIRCVNKLLEHVRAGKEVSRKSEINITPLVTRLFEKVRPPEVGGEVSIADSFPTLSGDPLTIERLFQNLLENSIQYRDPEKSRLSINLDYELSEGSIKILYQDNGSGIEGDKLKRIFDSWYTSEKENHLGIGLAIVKKTVEAHGGTISAKSGGTGQGTEFLITLPHVNIRGKAAEEPGHQRLPVLV